jgi:hypothetical protein
MEKKRRQWTSCSRVPKKKDAIDGDYNPDNDTHSTNLHSAPLAHVAVLPYSFLYVCTYAHTFFRRGTLIDSWKINQKKKSETRMEMRICNGGGNVREHLVVVVVALCR